MFRYTEEELRDFIQRQITEFGNDQHSAEMRDEPLEVAYAQGAYDSYKFVLLFMDEYRLEEVTND